MWRWLPTAVLQHVAGTLQETLLLTTHTKKAPHSLRFWSYMYGHADTQTSSFTCLTRGTRNFPILCSSFFSLLTNAFLRSLNPTRLPLKEAARREGTSQPLLLYLTNNGYHECPTTRTKTRRRAVRRLGLHGGLRRVDEQLNEAIIRQGRVGFRNADASAPDASPWPRKARPVPPGDGKAPRIVVRIRADERRHNACCL